MSIQPADHRIVSQKRFRSYYVNKIDWKRHWHVNYESTIEGVGHWLNQHVKNGDVVTFDCEWSKYKKSYPLGLIQLAVKGDRVLIIDCTRNVKVYIPISQLFENPMVKKIGFAIHNDIQKLYMQQIQPVNVIDLQPMIQKRYPEQLKKKFGHKSQYSLIDCVSIFHSEMEETLRGLKRKEQRNLQWSNPNHVFAFFDQNGQFKKWNNQPIRYAANDVIALWILFFQSKMNTTVL